jgi:hypothetical protein
VHARLIRRRPRRAGCYVCRHAGAVRHREQGDETTNAVQPVTGEHARRAGGAAGGRRAGTAAAAAPAPVEPAAAGRVAGTRTARIGPRTERALLLLGGALVVALLWAVQQRGASAPRQFTQADIDKAVLHTLATKAIPRHRRVPPRW